MERVNSQYEYPAQFWHLLADGRIQCDLCPRHCALQEEQRGLCFVRQRHDNQMVLTTYGKSSGFCIDPVEKKPLNHFYPGSSVLSFGTAGCNLACKFCQNWDISKSRDMDRLADQASPTAIANAAKQNACKSVAFTYNDPTIFYEYAVDVAKACHAQDVRTIAVTAGYISPEPRVEFYRHMDAANVDLKGFTDEFYSKICGVHLEPVLETLQYIKHHTQTWLEITNLLIPGQNDDTVQLKKMCEWIGKALGPEVPLHFSAFHPDYKMRDIVATPLATLIQARQIALDVGLHYVYTGNVHDADGDATYCPNCKNKVIERDWYEILKYHLDEKGNCLHCQNPIAGRFEKFTGAFGRKRIPLSANTFNSAGL